MVVPETEFHADQLAEGAEYTADNKYEDIPVPAPENNRRNQDYRVGQGNESFDETDRHGRVEENNDPQAPKDDFFDKILSS